MAVGKQPVIAGANKRHASSVVRSVVASSARRRSAQDNERLRAVELAAGFRLLPLRRALTEGCYSEIFETARRPEYRNEYQWLIRDFYNEFPDGGRIGRYMQKLFARTLAMPASWAFVRSDTGAVCDHDWLAVATGPRQQARQLAASVRESGRRLTHDITCGIMAAMLEPTRTAMLAAMGLSDGWPRRRMEMDLYRTCQLAAAELVLNVQETERGNLHVTEGWSNGHVSLWFVGRKMAHG